MKNLISIINQEYELPISIVKNKNSIEYTFKSAIVSVKMINKGSYVTYEIINIDGDIEVLLWGPIKTNNTVVREIIGISENNQTIFGMMSLNSFTIQGWPKAYVDICPFIEDLIDPPTTSVVGKLSISEVAAHKTKGGAVHVLHTLGNKSKVVFNNHKYQSEINANIIGSKVAIFEKSDDNILDLIERIVISEHLPYPIIDGVWAKKSDRANQSYLISEIDKNNVDDYINWCKLAKFNYLYHSEALKSWGKFEVVADLLNVTKRCNETGIKTGIHTLSNFVHLDNKLAISALAFKNANNILVKKQIANIIVLATEEQNYISKYAKRVIIDDVFYTFEEVKNGIKVIGLDVDITNKMIYFPFDHAYNVLLPNFYGQKIMEEELHELITNYNIEQISFDGIEGCESALMCDYGINHFVDTTLKGHNIICDGSRINSYLWHHFTRVNWGEPWGAKFREGMINERFTNLEFFERNFIPKMLGWFIIRPATRILKATTVEDINWLCAQSKINDAGFALVISKDAYNKLSHSYIDTMMEVISSWQTIKISDEDRNFITNNKGNCLIKDDNIYVVNEVLNIYFDHTELQPGQKSGLDLQINNQFHPQLPMFKISGHDGEESSSISNLVFIINGIETKISLEIKNKNMIYNVDNIFYLVDENFNILKQQQVDFELLQNGSNKFYFGCNINGVMPPYLEIKVDLLQSKYYTFTENI